MKNKNLIISIGANIKNPNGLYPIQTCERAIKAIEDNQIIVIKKSKWYISDPVPKNSQPKFFNCLIVCKTELDSTNVLKILLKIEKDLGRIRLKRKISRCIDLDLIDYSSRVKKSLRLTIPHPRSHLRKFVLLPMIEINPNWKNPIKKRYLFFFYKKISKQMIKIYKK